MAAGQTVLSGRELNEKLQLRFSITSENARKSVQRAVKQGYVKSSAPVTFGKGQYVYFSHNTYLNKTVVTQIAFKYRPSMYRLLSLLDLNDGLVSYYEALKVTACPLDNTKTKKNTLDEILDSLVELNLADIVIEQGIKYIMLLEQRENAEMLIKNTTVQMNLDCAFLTDIKNWLIRHNLIDNKNVRYRNKAVPGQGVIHNNFVWDGFAYTKSTGYNTTIAGNNKGDEKSTLVVLDVLVHRAYADIDLQGFYERVQGVICSTKQGYRKILPIIVLADTSTQVSAKIKGLGFINFNLGSIYGEKIYKLMSDLNAIKLEQLSGDGEHIAEHIDSALAAIKDSGQGENLQNLKGDLFEALMYPLLTVMYPRANIMQGVVLKRKQEKKIQEIDALAIDNTVSETIVFEMKGLNSSTVIQLGDSETYGTVRHFFRKVFPFAQEILLREQPEHFQNTIRACYITTAQFSEEALNTLEKLNKGKSKPALWDIYYDGSKLVSLLKVHGLGNVVDVLNKYYFK